MVEHCAARGRRNEIVEEFVATVLSSVDMSDVLDRMAALLRSHYGNTRVGLTLVARDDPSQAEVLLVDDPLYPTPAPGTRFPLAGTAAGEAMATRETVLVEKLRTVDARFPEEEALGELGYGTLACFPLVMGDQVLGTLDIAHIPRCGLLCECTRTAERLARLIAIALHNSFLVDEVRRLNRELHRENAYLRGRIEQAEPPGGYVADSAPMRALLARSDQAAATDTTVLIRGETGTGKEGLARRIHDRSPRADGPFVVVNVGAIPEGLIESELFGHEKGAFTGATARRLGCFEQADGGTLFLDEIGDAPAAVQVKLLRAIQEREIQRVGGRGTVQVDVRLIAATHRPLEQMIEEGTFRSDLYYRLAILPLVVPPLRERPGDIRALTAHLVSRHAARMGRRPPAIAEEVFAALEAHIWLGNVRELENFLERALIFSPGLSLVLPEAPGATDSRAPLTRTALPAPDPGPRFEEPTGTFDDQVRDLLRRTLDASGGKIYGPGGAAERLDLPPTTLQGKLRRYGVRVERRATVEG